MSSHTTFHCSKATLNYKGNSKCLAQNKKQSQRRDDIIDLILFKNYAFKIGNNLKQGRID